MIETEDPQKSSINVYILVNIWNSLDCKCENIKSLFSKKCQEFSICYDIIAF